MCAISPRALLHMPLGIRALLMAPHARDVTSVIFASTREERDESEDHAFTGSEHAARACLRQRGARRHAQPRNALVRGARYSVTTPTGAPPSTAPRPRLLRSSHLSVCSPASLRASSPPRSAALAGYCRLTYPWSSFGGGQDTSPGRAAQAGGRNSVGHASGSCAQDEEGAGKGEVRGRDPGNARRGSPVEKSSEKFRRS